MSQKPRKPDPEIARVIAEVRAANSNADPFDVLSAVQAIPSIQEDQAVAQCVKDREQKVARMQNVPSPGDQRFKVNRNKRADVYEKSDFEAEKARGRFVGQAPLSQCPNMPIHGLHGACELCIGGIQKARL